MNLDLKIEKLRPDHRLVGFDCGKEPLNRFLLRHALQTYVASMAESIVGYHTLVVGEVAHAAAPERLVRGLARHPIPLMLLARLAVSRDRQRRGIGPALLKDALLRTLRAADIAGIRGFAVHAKDEEARSFYTHFDFVPSPTDPMHLFVLLKDVKRLLG
jgi:GNAT superfamily N-acetyltransferase